jgi:hypothetical protein
MGRWTIAVGVAALAIVAGAFTLDVARDHPSFWFAGSTDFAGAALLAAGWALIACGLAEWLRRPESAFGPLLAAAGFAWFLLEWNNPGIGSAFAFTIGLVLYASCPPLVAHAVLAYPGAGLARASTAARSSFCTPRAYWDSASRPRSCSIRGPAVLSARATCSSLRTTARSPVISPAQGSI